MESQSGARTPLVDPFGRELEEWLRDAPATRAPYLSDLVVPPVTGPVQRPDAASDALAEPAVADSATADTVARPATADLAPADTLVDDSAFRRPRDRARHAAPCAPSFPEPPERIALRIEDLAVEVSSASGRPTIDRIVILEDEVRRRDEDLARLAAWEATVAGSSDPEVEAARAFAHTVFADLLADAAAESDRRGRAAARRIATGTVPVPLRPAEHPAVGSEPAARAVPAVPAAPTVHPTPAPPLVAATEIADAIDAPATTDADATSDGRDEPARPVLSLPVVSPVSANTRPTPLVQPATGPTVIDRAAFAAALTAHVGTTASTPVVLPAAVAPVPTADATTTDEADAGSAGTASAGAAHAGWWSRLVARIMQALGRR